jgi:hypothetical protein
MIGRQLDVRSIEALPPGNARLSRTKKFFRMSPQTVDGGVVVIPIRFALN